MQLHPVTAGPYALLPSGLLPVAPIMIFGNAGLDIEDHPYDPIVEKHRRPKVLIEALPQISNDSRARYGKANCLLDGDGGVPSRVIESLPKKIPAESDPSHLPTGVPYERERPGTEWPRRRDL